MTLELSDEERTLLDGDRGDGAALAMRLLVRMAEISRAPRLRPITRAHIDGCIDHGRAGLDFAERLLAGGARVAVPSSLNVGSLDLLHPELVRLEGAAREQASRLMDSYVALGCRPTWTCAPYQLPERPSFGEQIAWAESNAIVFANSVLGARTNRYGDFTDICAAIVGRVPDVGLHTDEGRRASMVVRLRDVPERLLDSHVVFPVLGHLLGTIAGSEVAVIDGLPAETSEDRLKALGAAAASSGSVALFHAAGVTPEASSVESVVASGAREVSVSAEELRVARDQLAPVASGARLGAVSVGTPHASIAELRRLAELAGAERPRVPLYVNTGRAQLASMDGLADDLTERGVTVVTDTCTYVTPILDRVDGPVMTDSGKWAWYAPSNLGVEVAIGSLEECVRSAAAGRVVRDETLWGS